MADARRLAIDTRFLGAGYGLPTPRPGRGDAPWRREAAGLTLDPTYTAKAFAARSGTCERAEGGAGPLLAYALERPDGASPRSRAPRDEDALDPRLRALLY